MSRLREMAASGELEKRLASLRELESPCVLCPRMCGAHRSEGETGFCGATSQLEVASLVVHGGEEPVLTGGVGVGNAFLAHCNLECVFCQNSRISQTGVRYPMSPEKLAEGLLEMQGAGCPTLGFVSPTHQLPSVTEAIACAVPLGLDRPLVYNSNGYDSVKALKLVEGIFDIYLPDFKYAGEAEALELSAAPGYPGAAIAAIAEMFRQVGPLELDCRGIARRGLIVRHLVLPNDLARTREVLALVASEVSPHVAVSLMAQYNPLHRAGDFPLLSRKLRHREYEAAVEALEELGLEQGWVQDWEGSPDAWVPDFGRDRPFRESEGVGPSDLP